MKINFEKSLEIILKHEGGFVNHPKDPGGITNLGVTKKTYEGYVDEEVSVEDMKALTVYDVEPIYQENYWDQCKCDKLPAGLDLCVFDFAVNAGPGRAAKHLQTLIDTEVDGGIGPNTLNALQDKIAVDGVDLLIENYQHARQEYYEGLSNFDTFGKGWTRRVEETTEEALSWVPLDEQPSSKGEIEADE
jgi:lysozyme family protein